MNDTKQCLYCPAIIRRSRIVCSSKVCRDRYDKNKRESTDLSHFNRPMTVQDLREATFRKQLGGGRRSKQK
jgi:hypothetical protein